MTTLSWFASLFMVSLLGALGCNGDSGTVPTRKAGNASPGVQRQAPNAGAEQDKNDQPAGEESEQRRIIYTAQLEVVVEDLNVAANTLTQFINDHDGYIAKAEIIGDVGTRRVGHWTVRIPVEHFHDLRQAVVALGKERVNSIDSEDVTEEYIDLEAEIKNKQVQEQRLNELMKQGAGNVEDVLEIEREITRVRGEIEKAQGRLKMLARLSAMATAQITLREEDAYIPADDPSYESTVSGTFWASVDALKEFGKNVLLIIVALAPWSPLILAFILVPWLIYRRRRNRETPVEVAPSEE